MPQLEFHQLDRRLATLRVRHPARQRRLLASLAETGQQTPIIVIENAGRYLVIDGHKRIAALEQLGRDTVEAVVWAMSETEALVLERSLRMSEPETALEQGWLLAEMESRLNCSIEELARRFDRSTTWVARRLALVELLPEAVQQLVRAGKIAAQSPCVSWRRWRASTPSIASGYGTGFGRATVDHAGNGGTLPPRKASASGARAHPGRTKLFLKAQPPPAATLEKELTQITAIAQRALARREESPPSNRALLQRKIQRATELLHELAQRIEEPAPHHVEPSPTRDHSGTTRPKDPQARDCTPVETLAPQRPPSIEVELQCGTEGRAHRESHALPVADPRVIGLVPRQPRASP
jgi:ParB/RepB/Spo0J family partition protein